LYIASLLLFSVTIFQSIKKKTFKLCIVEKGLGSYLYLLVIKCKLNPQLFFETIDPLWLNDALWCILKIESELLWLDTKIKKTEKPFLLYCHEPRSISTFVHVYGTDSRGRLGEHS
jgi:hypothetical protein